MRTVDDYKSVVVKTVGGTPIMLSAVAEVTQSTVNRYSAAMFNKEPSVLLIITKQADANVIDTVDGIKALIPELKRWIPAGIEISVLSDRTTTIRASVADMQLTLTLSSSSSCWSYSCSCGVPARRWRPASRCRCPSRARVR